MKKINNVMIPVNFELLKKESCMSYTTMAIKSEISRSSFRKYIPQEKIPLDKAIKLEQMLIDKITDCSSHDEYMIGRDGIPKEKSGIRCDDWSDLLLPVLLCRFTEDCETTRFIRTVELNRPQRIMKPVEGEQSIKTVNEVIDLLEKLVSLDKAHRKDVCCFN